VVRASSRRGAQRPASVVACERAGRAVPARRTGQGLTARELDRPCALNSRGLVVPTFAVGVAGAFLQIAGANWDVSSHVLGIVDTFFTPPHLVLYVGILLALVAGILGVLIIRPVAGPGDPRLPAADGCRRPPWGMAWEEGGSSLGARPRGRDAHFDRPPQMVGG